MNFSIYTILVTYNPNIAMLKKCISSMANQVTKIIIVDNTPLGCTELKNMEKQNLINIIFLFNNKGIAYAQNIGINIAIEQGADFILTSDQDTIYPENYVKEMISFYEKCKNSYKIGAIAPLFRDLNSRREIEPVLILNNKKIRKVYDVSNFEDCLLASHVISSGMIIPTSVLKYVGLMKEEYFIDWVDTEWCWRALKNKYQILINKSIHINHHLGDNSIKLGKFSLVNHNKIRKYYRLRNGIYILLYEKFNITIKKYIFISLLKMIILNFIFRENILIFIKILFNSFYDGITKKMGKIERSF
ncbi:glycosyltransferase family 2 protein [Treponema sp. J25]|uniref:glycosyltransferase family 2 protein n=1 Tax=Treponema sp. J25 TaxID=2094121 RepID=UPI0010472909|nr:glycosyltransferase family 2 protein [Treponema sp. J25]TCW60164.1 glycosyltransferase family 2 protein [Treponema sp. J25]